MPDTSPATGLPGIIEAVGSAGALLIGAWFLRPKSLWRRIGDVDTGDTDPDSRPARLRERITALETRVDNHDDRLDAQQEEIVLLRAQEVTAEAHARPRPRPRPRPRQRKP